MMEVECAGTKHNRQSPSKPPHVKCTHANTLLTYAVPIALTSGLVANGDACKQQNLFKAANLYKRLTTMEHTLM